MTRCKFRRGPHLRRGRDGLSLAEHELRSWIRNNVLSDVDVLRTRTVAVELEVVVNDQERQECLELIRSKESARAAIAKHETSAVEPL